MLWAGLRHCTSGGRRLSLAGVVCQLEFARGITEVVCIAGKACSLADTMAELARDLDSRRGKLLDLVV